MEQPIRRKLLFFIPVIAGALILGWITKGKKPPVRIDAREKPVSVRVIEVPEVTLIPRAIGYGNVRPGRIWEAVAETSGRIVEIHPQLKNGSIIAKEEILLRIDPTDYEIDVTRIEANMRAVEAQIKELDAREKNTRLSIEIEKRSLSLSEKELTRKRKLLNQGTVSPAAVDQEERQVLSGRQSLQSLHNALNLIPAERDILKAQLAQSQAEIKTAKLDLERTTIMAPFDIRIATVNVEETQFAQQGKVLMTADGIDVAEVTAQVPLEKLINLVPRGVNMPLTSGSLMGRLPEMLGFSATVRLRGASFNAEWPARFARISDTIDPETRTVGVIVAVDAPYRQTIPGVRPPLSKNMFVEVELRGKPRHEVLVVPRSSLHGHRIYVVTPENRLEVRKVGIAFMQTGFAVISEGLKAGDKIVVSDPIPAIEGMLLNPVDDKMTAQTLQAEAIGEGSVK